MTVSAHHPAGRPCRILLALLLLLTVASPIAPPARAQDITPESATVEPAAEDESPPAASVEETPTVEPVLVKPTDEPVVVDPSATDPVEAVTLEPIVEEAAPTSAPDVVVPDAGVPEPEVPTTDSIVGAGLDDPEATSIETDDVSAAIVVIEYLVLPPTAVDDAFSIAEDAALQLSAADLVSNDIDPNGDQLIIAGVDAVSTAGGTVTVGGANALYVPPADFNGVDTFTYTVSDGSQTDVGTVIMTVTPANDPPVAADDRGRVFEGFSGQVRAIANDTDPEGDALTVIAVSDPARGTAAIDVADLVTYTPDPGVTSGEDTFTYTVSDGNGGTDQATVTFEIVPTNDRPVAGDDIASTAVGTAVRIAVLANDTDPEGDALSLFEVSQPANGSIDWDVNNVITYTPRAGFAGQDAFTYRVADYGLFSNYAAVTVTVTQPNRAPVAGDDTITTDEDTAVDIAILTNDTDAEGDSLSVAIDLVPVRGTVAVAVDGTITYTPDPNANGSDAFTYQVSDGTATDTATVDVTITPANDAPIANDDSATTTAGSSVAIPVLANDTDADGDPLRVGSISDVSNGRTSIAVVGGPVVYTPNPGFAGTDTFTYAASDGRGGFSTLVTVTITVVAPNLPPVAVADAAVSAEDTLLFLSFADIVGNDTDPSGDRLTFAGVSPVSTAGATLLVAGGIFYLPPANFHGVDTFTYTVSDGALTANGTVTVTVTPVNDAPVANNDPAKFAEDTSFDIPVLANDTDADGDPLVVAEIVSAPAHGTATLGGPNGSVTYTPNPDFNGDDSFTYRAGDGTTTGNVATVEIIVLPSNDAPVAVDDAYTTLPDTTLSVPHPSVTANDRDVDGDEIVGAFLRHAPANGSATITVNRAGISLEYTPDPGFVGSDTFTYQIKSGSTFSNDATVTISVVRPNHTPVAVDDAVTTAEDTAITVMVLANDTDPDRDVLIVTGAIQPAKGAVTVNADGTITYTPNPNATGSDSFGYAISDGTLIDIARVNITVAPVNDLPVAVDDAATTTAGTPVDIPVLANDTDADGDYLTISGINRPAVGETRVLSIDGPVTYTPPPGFVGTDTFLYRVWDAAFEVSEATVTITVTAAPVAPVAVDDAATTAEDRPVTVDVLANDTDPNGDPLTVTAVSNPAIGTVVDNGDGTATYSPNPNANGADAFTYTVSDGTLTDSATVTITVTAVNDAPVAAADAYTTAEDTQIVVAAPGLLTNDDDVDGDALTVTGVTQPATGTVALDGTGGAFTFTPGANVTGPVTFTYDVSDGSGATDTATVTIAVTAVNDAPVAAADSATTAEDTAATVAVLPNDRDADGDLLAVTGATDPANGAVVVNPDGTVTYTPDPDLAGPTDTFTYTVTDGQLTDTATVTVTIAPADDAPRPRDDSASTAEDTAVIIPVIANDVEVDGEPLTLTATSDPARGSAVVNLDGTVTYTPDPNVAGSDTFTYTVTDGVSTATATVTVTVTAVNDAPVAIDDTAAAAEDTPVTVAVLANDVDPDGDALTVTAASDPTSGSVTVNQDGTVTYTPGADLTGPDAFSYTVSDGVSVDTATVAVTVGPGNDPPVAAADAAVTDEDTAVVVAVLANDRDVDRDDLTVTEVTAPANGSAAINRDGTVTYTPDPGFNGTDVFAYTVDDGAGGTDTAEVTVSVAPVNDGPDAVDDSAAVDEDDAVDIDVLANDTDPEGDLLTVSVATGPANGSATITQDGSVIYRPAADVHGVDSFTYTVADPGGDTATATVIVTIAPVNDAPVGAADDSATDEDEPVTIVVLANDTDLDGDFLTVTGTLGAAIGTATVNADGTVTYAPAADANGSDTFQYTVSDGTTTATAAVTVAVAPVNDAPVAADDVVTTDEDASVVIAVLANDTDVEGDPLAVTIVLAPTNGGAVVEADGTVTYSPAQDVTGADTFSYGIDDGQGGTDSATVTVTVAAAPDVPTVVDDTATVDEDGSATIDVLANDVDPDGDPLALDGAGPAGHGTVVVNADGTVTYTPDAGFNGTDAFPYSVSSATPPQAATGAGAAVVNGTVTVTVVAVDDAPVAVDDAASVDEGSSVVVDVLANDTHQDGDALTVVSITVGPPDGVVEIVGGTVMYTPAPGFAGTDTLTYEAADEDGDTGDATLTVTVVAMPILDGDEDGDEDGVADDADNCPDDANPDQEDADGDETGDACDETPNGDPTPEPTVEPTATSVVVTLPNTGVGQPTAGQTGPWGAAMMALLLLLGMATAAGSLARNRSRRLA